MSQVVCVCEAIHSEQLFLKGRILYSCGMTFPIQKDSLKDIKELAKKKDIKGLAKNLPTPEEVSQSLKSIWDEAVTQTKTTLSGFTLDVIDGEHEITVLLDVPDTQAKDITVSYSHHLLTVEGQRQGVRDGQGNAVVSEFQRAVKLPYDAPIDTAKINAVLDQGVLTVVLPKTEKKVKNVKVQTAGTVSAAKPTPAAKTTARPATKAKATAKAS